MFLDHFFGENVLFHQFDPTNTPKCYTWLESYGSSLRHGKNKKIFFPPCEASDFRGRSQTDFLHDLEARLMQSCCVLLEEMLWLKQKIQSLERRLESFGEWRAPLLIVTCEQSGTSLSFDWPAGIGGALA